MYPVGSTSFTPLSATGLCEAVTTRPVAAPVFRALAAMSRPHLQRQQMCMRHQSCYSALAQHHALFEIVRVLRSATH